MVAADLMLKSCIPFIPLNRDDDYTAEESFKTCSRVSTSINVIISTSDCSAIVCLRILNTHTHTYIYIGDVKVSPEGRCLELLQ